MIRSPRRRSVAALAALLALALFLPACAPKTVDAPQIVDADYLYPAPPRGLLEPREEKAFRSAWNDVLTGQTARAEITLNKLLLARPDLLPARAMLGFAALRANRLKLAEETFSGLLLAEPDNPVILIGLASVRRRVGHEDQALLLYMRAQRLRPGDEALARRVGEAKMVVAESAIANAGSLSAEGRKTEAMAMLRKALDVAPELAPVRLELADLLLDAGERTEAVAVLDGAQEPDRNIAIRIATIRFEDGEVDAAEMALRRGLRDVAEDAEGAALLARILERRAFLALPEPLRAIGDAPRVTRAELAALVVERVEALRSREPKVRGVVASDLSRSWARPQILRAIELGLMEVYPNHTFQPRGAVRRGELAVVAARVLDHVGFGRVPAPAPSDMSPSHLQYASVVRVVGAGVMQKAPSGAFEPWRIISGAEAKAVVEALARLSSSR